MIKAIVVRVEVPKVAHAPGTFEVTVVYARKVKWDHVRPDTGEVFPIEVTKKIKKQVFTAFRPAIGQALEVQFT